MNDQVTMDVGKVVGHIVEKTALELRKLGFQGTFSTFDDVYRYGMTELRPMMDLVRERKEQADKIERYEKSAKEAVDIISQSRMQGPMVRMAASELKRTFEIE